MTKNNALTEENYETVFQAMAQEHTLHVSQLPSLLNKVYGALPSDREVALYTKLLENNDSEYLSWTVFKETMQNVNAFLVSQSALSSLGSVKPPWMIKDIPEKVLMGGTCSSSHKIDFGEYGQKPTDRPYVRKTGMASTTLDLSTGTSRDTHHIPGYRGLIPNAPNNPEATAQGDGTKPRDKGEDIRLYHRDNIPGYTGHKAQSCNNYRGEITNGTDNKTTNGATYVELGKRI